MVDDEAIANAGPDGPVGEEIVEEEDDRHGGAGRRGPRIVGDAGVLARGESRGRAGMGHHGPR
jgi:hypothetical protein